MNPRLADGEELPVSEPWPRFEGDRPKPCKIEASANVGLYVGNNVLYFTQQVDAMASYWHKQLGKSRYCNDEINASKELRKRSLKLFYQKEGGEMSRQKYQYLKPLLANIADGCRYLMHFQLKKGAPLGHLNFQRRCYFMLLLTLEALCDLRLYEHKGDEVDFRTKSIINMKLPDKNADIIAQTATEDIEQLDLDYGDQYASGMKPKPWEVKPSNTYVTNLNVSGFVTSEFAPSGSVCSFRLPAHAVILVGLLAKCERMQCRFFRLCLAPYALFLVRMIQDPDNYYINYWPDIAPWFDSCAILDLPPIINGLTFGQVFSRLPNNPHLQQISANGTDLAMVSRRDLVRHYATGITTQRFAWHDYRGLKGKIFEWHPFDLTESVCSETDFDDMIMAIRDADCAAGPTCPHTGRDYFFRLMVVPYPLKGGYTVSLNQDVSSEDAPFKSDQTTLGTLPKIE